MPPPASAWMRISELSRRVGVTTDTLRVWERRYGLLKPRRTAGNTRLYSALDEARVRLMKRYISEQIPPAQAAELSMAARLSVRAGRGSGVPEHAAARVVRELQDAFAAFEESSAERALHELLSDYSATAVIREVLLPFVREAGERRRHALAPLAREHFAENFLHSRLLALARGWDRGLGPRALIACPPVERHPLDLIVFGIALHHLGWRITYLGAATPLDALGSTAESVAPDLIVLATQLPDRLAPHVDAIRRLGTRWPVALVGPASGMDVARRCGLRHLGEDAVAAAGVVASGDLAVDLRPPVARPAAPGRTPQRHRQAASR